MAKRAGSSFDHQEKTTKVGFPQFFFAVLSSEISFSFSPTIVTRTRDMPVPRSHEDMLVHRILHFSRSTSQSQRRSEKSRFTEFTLLLVIKGTGLS